MTYSNSALGRLARWRQRVGVRRLGMRGLALLAIVGGSALTGLNPEGLQTAERQVQSQFWQWRGVTPPPQDVVVLAVDEPTLNQVSNWPMPRAKYGEVIDRIMAAGAKAVAVDVIWDFPSSFGNQAQSPDLSPDCEKIQLSADDRALVQVLKKYGDRIVLATRFEDSKGEGWKSFRLALPYCPYREVKAQFGNVNFLFESDQRVHRLGREYLRDLVKKSPETYGDLMTDAQISSFAEAALKAAIAALLRRYYGPRSETFDPRQLLLFGQRIEQLPLDEASLAEEAGEPLLTRRAKNRHNHGRQQLPESLERIEIEHDLADSEKACPACGCARCRIGAEVSEQLEYFPASFKVLKHVRHKYGCAKCDGEGYNPNIATAVKPPQPD
ncbi:MAG: CHASE2 domain-containing protein [Alkalinema sp. RU_4_3]|nr:CHASE2 domain-containing protein [Alkalinema sp. RU_4_3]